MNAPSDNVNETSIEYWKSRCHALEKQETALQQKNESLAKQNAETHQENLKLIRIIEHLKDKLKMVQVQTDESCHVKISPPTQNDYDLFFTFPEEIWPSILVYLNDPVTLLNLCGASPLLDIILLDKEKPVWLFDQILPSLFKWLTEKEILTCRLVCKKWNRVIDNYLDSYQSPDSRNQQQITSTDYSPSHVSPLIWESKLEPVDFDNTADLIKFQVDAKAHQGINNRKHLLISRSLKLGLDMERDENNDFNDVHEFWEFAIGLIHTIGRDIWHIEFFNDGFEEEPSSFYGFIQQLICYLPNLKTLRLICDFDNNRGGRREQEDLLYRLGEWPLPNLPCLETLHVLHTMPSSMISCLAACYARQLKRFVVSVAILILLDEEYLRGFVSLTELVLRDCVKDVHEFQRLMRRLERLESPNLEKLRLFRSYSDDEVISTTYLFGLISQKFPKLRGLDTYRMEVKTEVNDPNDKNESLCVYSLRTLKIRNSPRLRSYNFLKQLPFLEELCVRDESNQSTYFHPSPVDRLPSRGSTEEGNKIPTDDIDVRRYLYQGKLYESNIWEVMPSLTLVTYESFDEQIIPSGRYTREMYDLSKKKQNNQV